jgi:hypothetical protein
MLMVYLPVQAIKHLMPLFLPYNIRLSRYGIFQAGGGFELAIRNVIMITSFEEIHPPPPLSLPLLVKVNDLRMCIFYSEVPMSELSLELLLLQVILPALLEQGHTRQWLKGLVRGWLVVTAYLL